MYKTEIIEYAPKAVDMAKKIEENELDCVSKKYVCNR